MVVEITPARALITATWDDVPHLDQKTKDELLASARPHEREARAKGIPSLGAGAIYPVDLDEVLIAPFQIPAYWPRLYGMDVGWKATAAVWASHDRDTDTVYLYSEYKAGEAKPLIHATAIKARGAWIPGEIDPASNGRAQADGKKLFEAYRALGLKIKKADNAVEAGIMEVLMRMQTGRLKVFSTLKGWEQECRLYRRAENGKVVKENDHLMDAMRYAIMGLKSARTRPIERAPTRSSAADKRAGY